MTQAAEKKVVNLTPYSSRPLNRTQKLIAGLLASGSTPEEIEQFSDGSYKAYQIKQLQHNASFVRYLETCEDNFVDKLLSARVKTTKVLLAAAEDAARKIADLSQNASNQETQRRASIDVITLAGLKAPEKVEHTAIPHLQIIFNEPDCGIVDDNIIDVYEEVNENVPFPDDRE